MRIAILGGAFNPPTLAYERIVRSVLDKGRVDEVWLVPYRQRAFGKYLGTAPEHRLAMANLLAKHIGGRVRTSDHEIRQSGKSYTIDTQRAFMQLHPEHTFDWIIGSDILYELGDWKDIDELQRLTRFLCVMRPGYPLDKRALERYGAELFLGPRQVPDVSSSEVRRRVRSGKPVTDLVPAYIAQFIEQHGLYREA